MLQENREICSNSAKLPQEFIEIARASIGDEALAIYLEHFNNSANEGVTSIRTNPHKKDLSCSGASSEALKSLLEGAERVPWCSNGYYLPKRPLFTLDPLFHCGAYYVQEASSMFAEAVWRAICNDNQDFATNRLKVLDLCAAPGGKSTHIVSLIDKESLLISNEVIKSRSVILADNMAKWGAENVLVTNNDPRDFKSLESCFDIIFVDAPCSGEGMFIKEPAAIKEWSPANVDLCASRQKRILQDIWGSLKPNGYLVYSTCTFNHFENDDNLHYIVNELGAESIEVDFFTPNLPDSSTTLPPHSANTSPCHCTNTPQCANSSHCTNTPQCANSSHCTNTPQCANILRSSAGGYQFVPGMVKGEGQYVAVVKKLSGREREERMGSRMGRDKFGSNSKGNKNSKGELKNFNYLSQQLYDLVLMGDMIKAYPKELANEIKFFESKLRIVSSGIAAATLKGRDFIPHADLALTGSYSQMVGFSENGSGQETNSPFPIVELTKEQALAFLSKEPLVLDNEPNGYLLLRYLGYPLGFVKNLGNRTNNLWPQARRIRMAH